MPNILIPDSQTTYLTDRAYQSDELDLLIDRAERRVKSRYRENLSRNDFRLSGGGEVRLDGWTEDDEGNPDLEAMDDALLDALRASIAEIVEHWASRPAEAEHLESKSQGARSVSFRDDTDLPSAVYAPLRPYDTRKTLSTLG
jgi:hypothetical protein